MKFSILVFLIMFSSFSYSHEIKTVIVELNGMDFVNDDLTYGNQILWIPEIDDQYLQSNKNLIYTNSSHKGYAVSYTHLTLPTTPYV